MLKSYKVVPGAWYGTPKEVWGFRSPGGGGSASEVARRFLNAHTELIGLEGIGSHLRQARIIKSCGATHVLFQQYHRGTPIHRAYVTVHVAKSGDIYLVKNRAVPKPFLPVWRPVLSSRRGPPSVAR